MQKTKNILFIAMLLLPWASHSYGQIKTVSGSVISNEDGMGIPFLNVIVKGTTSGTATDMDGKFSIQSSSGDTLVFSFVGMKTQEIVVGSQTKIDVTLMPENTILDEVVVIGYGTLKKSNVTSAISSVKAEDIRNMPVYGVDQAIQGRMSGIQVTQASGSPGESATVRIRGTGTVGVSDPLYVVDGLPVGSNISNINPGDIERVDILKDASAAAIYGARAANGVVLITTKKGKAGKNVLTFDAYSGIQTPANTTELANAQEFGQIISRIEDAKGSTRTWTDAEVSALGEGTDWWDAVLSPAAMSSYQLSASGGGERGTFMFSGNYYGQDGIMTNSYFKRLNARINTEIKVLNDRVTIGENLSIAHKNKRPSIDENHEWMGLYNLYLFDPTVPVYNDQPDPSIVAQYGSFDWSPSALVTEAGNPVGMIERRQGIGREMPILGNAYVNVNPIKGLNFRSQIGLNCNWTEYTNYNASYWETATNNTDKNTLQTSMGKHQSWEVNHTVTYERKIREDHDFTLLGGHARGKYFGYGYNIKYLDVSENPDFWWPDNNVDTLMVIDKSYPDVQAMSSYFGRINYAFKDKYLFEAAIRRDGSSKFGKNNRYGIFPSFSGGWIISKEPFFNNRFSMVNMCKLRGGWGQLGNDQIENFVYAPLITEGYDSYTLGALQKEMPGATSYGLPNPNAKWEATTTINTGLDIAIMENKWQFTFDYFQRNTTDMLVNLPVPYFSGINATPAMNAGAVKNTGCEVELTYNQAEGRLHWHVSGNFAVVNNAVTDLGEGGNPFFSNKSSRIGAGFSKTDIGYPIAGFYGYETDGLFQTQDEIENSAQSAEGATVLGGMKFVDQNGDGEITDKDKVYLGSPHNKYAFGLSASFDYKGFDLVMMIQGAAGGMIWNATKYFTHNNRIWNASPDMLNAWSAENTDTDVPALNDPAYTGKLFQSDYMVEQSDYIRFKNIQLGYTLPTKLVRKWHASKLRLYVAGQNLLTFTQYTGNNPEVGLKAGWGENASRQVNLGTDWGSYPIARIIMVGVNASF